MTRWAGKYIIGLTGNIAAGKSVVRKMLQHLGAFGIDADNLAHQAMAKGAPAYGPVVKAFGEWLLDADGQINRAALGQVVFADSRALAALEAIVHPVVGQALDILISRAPQPVVVVEAIKLLEAKLDEACNAVWVVVTPEAEQAARLMSQRGMTEAQARLRMAAQSPQANKVARANVVIDNNGTLEAMWAQVRKAWSAVARASVGADLASALASAPASAPAPASVALAGKVAVRRWRPADAAAIATFIEQASAGARRLDPTDIISSFRDYFIADAGGTMTGLAGWQVENLVTRVDEMYVASAEQIQAVSQPLLEAVENASHELQSEAALVFAPQAIGEEVGRALAGAGYALQEPEDLTVNAWREAAKESQPPGTVMLFKRLREDRVLRPV